MALSGSLNSTGYKGRYIQFSWTATQDVEKNQSTISWTLKGAGTGESGWYKAGGFKVVIDGSTVYSVSTNTRITLYDGTLVASGTKTITHNSDGSRTFAVSIQAGIFYFDVNCTGSTTFTLNTIPRASTFKVSSTSANMGANVTFTITPAASTFKHKLTLTWGGTVSDIATNVGTSATWSIPYSLANDLPNNTSSGCIITCITYNGSTEIGRKTLSMTIKVPANDNTTPKIDSVTISEAVSGLATKFGAYVQNQSKLKVVTAASGKYSATIDSFSVKILNKTYRGSTITSDIITSSGSVNVVVTVTDSRGYTNSTTKSVSVTAYTAPTISSFTAQRTDSAGNPDDEGERVKFAFKFSVTSLSSKNDKSYTLSYRVSGGSSWTQLTTGSSYSVDTTHFPTTAFSGDNAYEFMLTVADYFKSVSQIVEIETASVLMDFHSSGTGMAIGKVAKSENLLEVALKTQFNEDVTVTGAHALYGAHGIFDTRSTNETPEWYMSKYKRGVVWEFKELSALQFTNPDATYGPLQTIIPWNDASGGLPRQVVYEGGTRWTRIAASATAWGAWVSDSLRAYPVGSIYFAYSHTSPAELFGGTWTRIENAFLWAIDAQGRVGLTGGEKTVTLTVEQIPSHDHGAFYTGTTDETKNTPWMASGGDKMKYVRNYVGGGQPHNNIPPYIQVSVWRRTA